jgi:PAS domain S-box-containing protein
LRRILDWFVPAAQRQDELLRRRIHVFVIAHGTGLFLTAGLTAILYREVPLTRASLAWLAPCYFALCLMPLGLKLVPRLDIVAALSAQAFALSVLASCHFIGGFRSPAMIWLIPAFASSVYYLAPWPAWRRASTSAQLAQIGAYIALSIWILPARALPPSDELVTITMGSAVALIALNSIVVAFLWSSSRADLRTMTELLTARDAATDALRRSRDDLARAQKIGRMGSIVFDVVTGDSDWSDQQFSLLGLDPVSAGPSFALFLSCVHPDDRQGLMAERERNLRGENPASHEYRVVLPSGETRWMRRDAEVERDESGRPVILHATTQDITESKLAALALAAAQDELKVSEARYRSYFESALDGQFLTSPNGSILDVNTAACEMLGRPAEEIKRLGRSGLVDVSDPRLDAALKERARTGKTRAEFDMIRADGTKIPVEAASSVFIDAAGRSMTTMSVRDLTERKRAEARQIELERQLAQAQKMEAIGQLTGGVAHDFNNLLSVILGRLHMLEDELADGSDMRAWVGSAIRAAERGANLTKSLLAFSRQQALKPVEVDLPEVIADTEGILRRGVGEAYEVRVAMAPALWHVEVDPGQLQNALMNLVFNSRDAMPNGGTVTISATNMRLDGPAPSDAPQLRPGDYVVLAVSDSGIGMPREIVERVFQPFFTTKGVGKGTGLGLSMVYGFVQQSGGQVTIDSEPDVGTTVRLYLPRGIAPPSATRAVDGAKSATRGGGEKILVVEDDQEIRALTRIQLTRLGYVVLDAPDGPSGLKVLSENPDIRLLLSDVIMPNGMSGPQLADRAVAIRPDLRIVLMSGYNDQFETLNQTRWQRPVRSLQKPFPVEELATEIRAALD